MLLIMPGIKYCVNMLLTMPQLAQGSPGIPGVRGLRGVKGDQVRMSHNSTQFVKGRLFNDVLLSTQFSQGLKNI